MGLHWKTTTDASPGTHAGISHVNWQNPRPRPAAHLRHPRPGPASASDLNGTGHVDRTLRPGRGLGSLTSGVGRTLWSALSGEEGAA